ncbi:MAG: TolC family protein, partial [Calditrichaeota bacterium]|nr:TolC family protein [Calditrichota bacterium]
PEIRAMNASRAIAEKQVAICKGEFLPKAFVIGNFDYRCPNREIEPEFYATWNMTLALQLDLFHGGAKYYRLQQANLTLRQLNESYAVLSDAIRLEVRQSYLALEEARQALRIAGKMVVQAEESYRVTSSNFKAGTATNADVLDAQLELTQAQMQQVAAQADVLLAKAKLARASAS